MNLSRQIVRQRTFKPTTTLRLLSPPSSSTWATRTTILHPRHFSTRRRPPQPNPADFPQNLINRYDPDFIRIYTRHLASKLDSRYLPLSKSRGRQTYASLPISPAIDAGVTWHDVPLRRGADNTHITLRVYTPPNTSRDASVVIYFPGGGFVLNGVDSEHGLAAHIAILTSSIVVSVGYRLAPEHPFPAAVHDAIAAVDWVRTTLAGWEYDATLMELLPSETAPRRKVALLGASAGGGLAAGIAAKEGMQRGIDAVGCWVPIVDWSFDPVPATYESKYSTLPKSPAELRRRLDEYGEDRRLEDLPKELRLQLNIESFDEGGGRNKGTYDDIADNPFLSTAKMAWFRSQYLPESSSWTDPFASPLFLFKSPGLETGEPDVDPVRSAELDGGEGEVETRSRKWRRTLRYPAISQLPLNVPPMRIALAESDVLFRQGLEFGNAVRYSLFPKRGTRLYYTSQAELETDYYSSAAAAAEEAFREGEVGGGGLFDPGRPADYYGGFGGEDEMYEPKAEKWVTVKTVPKAAHCLVSAAGESSSGRAEVERMARWVRGVFDGSLGGNDKVVTRESLEEEQEWQRQRQQQRGPARWRFRARL